MSNLDMLTTEELADLENQHQAIDQAIDEAENDLFSDFTEEELEAELENSFPDAA